MDPLWGGANLTVKKASIEHGNTLTARTNTPAGSPEEKPTLPVASLLWLEMQQPLAGGFLPLLWLPGSELTVRLLPLCLLVADVVPFILSPLEVVARLRALFRSHFRPLASRLLLI